MIQFFNDAKELSSSSCDGPKIISNGSVEADDTKVVDDPQVFKNPKVILNRSIDFDSPKVYGNTSIFDGLVFCCCQ